MADTPDKLPAQGCHPSVRRWIYLRAGLLGALIAAWWILFAPDAMVSGSLKIILGIAAGVIASGSYLFHLRRTLNPEKRDS